MGSARVLHLFSQYYDDPEDPDQLIDLVGLARSIGHRGVDCPVGSSSASPWRSP